LGHPLNPKVMALIRIGPRLCKTGLAVAVTVWLSRLTGHHYEVYGAVAAALAVAPTAHHSLRAAAAQIGSNVLGGLIGGAFLLLFGANPVAIGAAVITALLLCQVMKWQNVSFSALTVTLFVMVAPHTDSVAAYAIWRLFAVMLGSVVGSAINALILPPNYWPSTVAALRRAGAELDGFTRSVSACLARPASYTKAEVLAAAARVESAIAQARSLRLLLDDADGSGRPAVAERSIKVLGSLLERVLVIHKAALVAERHPEFPAHVGEIQAALEELTGLREAVYQGLEGNAQPETLAADLLALERRFESPVGVLASPEELEGLFRLHRMRSGLAYMANRLGRLMVAMDAGLNEPHPARHSVPNEA